MAFNEDDNANVICKKRKTLVSFASDEIINIIIPNDNTKLASYRKKKSAGEVPTTPRAGGKARYTRSGRQITSQLERLSLHEASSPQKTVRFSDTDPEEPAGFELEKPTEQLFEEEKIDGGTIFSFRTPKRQNGMVDKACESVGKKVRPEMESCGTVEKEKRKASRQSKAAPEPTPPPEPAPPKTPYRLRGRFKQCIAKEAEIQELDALLEDSGSEYDPTGSESDSDSSESDDAKPLSPESSPEKDQSFSPIKRTRQQIKDFVFSSDDYFDRRYSKNVTSNNTLKKLKMPKMAPSQVASLLKTVPNNHVEAYKCLEKTIESAFRRWMFSLSEGYNIMLYGLGSKRDVLSKFHAKYLKDSFTVEIHGYFPDNMVKEVLASIATNCLNMKNVPSQPHDIIGAIAEKMNSTKSNRIFILFSNLDGRFLQSDKTQTLVSQLVSIPKIHMIATIDHINSALLWDQSKLSAFNFVWEDASTFKPYTEETSYEGSLMVNWSGGIAISSLKNVFTSLTSNSRKVFKILLKHHLDNLSPKYQGMHFSDLYRECRSGFVVSSDLALRTLLTEFMDHELVKWKKETDHLFITVDLPVLKQFNSEIGSYM